MLESEKSLLMGDLLKFPMKKKPATAVRTISGGCTDLMSPAASEGHVRAFITGLQANRETAGTGGLSKLSTRRHLQIFTCGCQHRDFPSKCLHFGTAPDTKVEYLLQPIN